MPNNSDALIHFVRERLDAIRDPQRAKEMAAYMKTDMPFFGVKATERKKIERLIPKHFPVANRKQYDRNVRELWNQPERECKYLAISTARAFSAYIDSSSLPLYRTMIIQGAWWDLVDEIAVHLVGEVLRKQPEKVYPLMDAWIEDDDLWVRRTAILCQIRFKEKTDRERLFAYCLNHAHEKDFFIRKAIGWALREYSKTDPEKVLDFCEKHREILAGLSYREATRRIAR